MAKKSTTKNVTPEGEIENAGTVILVPLSRITVNAAIVAREGEPDAEKVAQFAENFVERVASGRPHQLSPALVRSEDGETFELIDGRHRLEACKMAQEADPSNQYMLLVRVVAANDEDGLVDAIQSNEFREDPNDFDRAAGIEKLIALGKTQAQCATIYGLSEGSISQIRKVGQLEKKYRKAIEDGDLDRDSAIFIAGLDEGDNMREEVFQMAISHKNKMLDLESRIEAKRLRAAAEEKLQVAKDKVEVAKEQAKVQSDLRKNVEKEMKEQTAAAAKTKEVAELIKIREREEKLKAEAETLAAKEREHLAIAEKAAKEVEKAKAEKEKVKEQTANSKKAVTQEDAKAAAQAVGATKGGKKVTSGPRTSKTVYNELEALATDENDPIEMEAVKALMGKMQSFIDGEISPKQLRNSFEFNCKTNEQLTAHKAKGKAAGKR